MWDGIVGEATNLPEVYLFFKRYLVSEKNAMRPCRWFHTVVVHYVIGFTARGFTTTRMTINKLASTLFLLENAPILAVSFLHK